MNKQVISYLWDWLETLYRTEHVSSCLDVVNDRGQRCLFLSCGGVLPASVTLSGQKAQASYAFHMPSQNVVKALAQFGSAPVLEGPYCFLPGGLPVLLGAKKPLFLGLSTDRPDQDEAYINRLAEDLTNFTSTL